MISDATKLELFEQQSVQEIVFKQYKSEGQLTLSVVLEEKNPVFLGLICDYSLCNEGAILRFRKIFLNFVVFFFGGSSITVYFIAC